MNNLLSNCGLVDPRISVSDKDSPDANNYFGEKIGKTDSVQCSHLGN